MHTIKVIGFGFLVLVVCLIAGVSLQGTRGMARSTLVFLPLWAIAASVNMYMGVHRAGYTVTQEIPFFLLVFLVPVLPSLLVWWKLH